MAIEVNTTGYECAHGKKPKGRGQWAFERKASHGREAHVFCAPGWMTFKEAAAWCRKQVRAEGFQDATVMVGA